MDNLPNASTIRRSCWSDGMDRTFAPFTPLAPLTPLTLTTSSNATGFGHDSISCGYLDLTPPGPEYSRDDWSGFRNWSYHWKRCSKCQSPINPVEPTIAIMDATYHRSCVTCSVCSRRIANCDSFVIEKSHIYCSTHFKPMEPVSQQRGGSVTRNQSIEMPQERLQELRNCPEVSYPTLSNLVERSEDCASVRNVDCSSSCPPKRVRTSFTTDQLETLGNFFENCRKPSSGQLEELSVVMGLKINVLRVWFQNARARFRRRFSSEMKEKENTYAFNVVPR